MRPLSKKHRIKKNLLFCMASFILFFFPPYFMIFEVIHNLYYVIGSAVSLLFILLWIIRWRKKTNSVCNFIIVFVFLFYFIILIQTIANGGLVNTFFANSIMAVGFCSGITYFFNEKNTKSSLLAMIIWLETCVILNFITVILFPDGLYRIYGHLRTYSNPAFFLGHRNDTIEYMIPLIAASMFYDLIYQKRTSKNHYFILAICIMTALMTRSVNELLAIVAVVGLEFIAFSKKRKIVPNIFIVYVIFFALSFVLIYLNYITSFLDLLDQYFGKTNTIGSRMMIWSRSIAYILKKPFTGYGAEETAIKFLHIGHGNSCHNYFLDYLYYGGIPLLIIVTVIFFILSKNIKDKDIGFQQRVLAIMIAYFILWMGSPIHKDTLFYMFTVCTISARVLNNVKTDNRKRLVK